MTGEVQQDEPQYQDDHDNERHFYPTRCLGTDFGTHGILFGRVFTSAKFRNSQGFFLAKAGKDFAKLANVYIAGSMGM